MTYIRTDVSGAVARVTLDDPDRRNILSGGLVTELIAAFDAVEGRADVTAVVLTGAGPAFCAGADLTDLLAGADGDPEPVRRVYGGFDRVRRSPLVTIAAVNGPAVGAGMNLALVCDLRIAAVSAWFDCRFLGIGLHPGGGHLRMLQRLVGPQTAAAMVLAGRRLDAAAARSRRSGRCGPYDRAAPRRASVSWPAPAGCRNAPALAILELWLLLCPFRIVMCQPQLQDRGGLGVNGSPHARGGISSVTSILTPMCATSIQVWNGSNRCHWAPSLAVTG